MGYERNVGDTAPEPMISDNIAAGEAVVEAVSALTSDVPAAIQQRRGQLIIGSYIVGLAAPWRLPGGKSRE